MRRPWSARIALAVLAGLLALAAPAPALARGRTAAAEGHQCACGPGCLGNCCCARRSAAADRPEPRPAARAPGAPCLRSAPCGERGLPASSPTLRGERLAACVAVEPLGPQPTRRPLAAEPTPAHDDPALVPPPEPPERRAST
jgi:hypothetical protein